MQAFQESLKYAFLTKFDQYPSDSCAPLPPDSIGYIASSSQATRRNYPWPIVSVKLGNSRAVLNYAIIAIDLASRYRAIRGNGANTRPNLMTDTRLAFI